MNFAFSEEQEELRRTVRQFLEAKSPETEVRRLMETPEGSHVPQASDCASRLRQPSEAEERAAEDAASRDPRDVIHPVGPEWIRPSCVRTSGRSRTRAVVTHGPRGEPRGTARTDRRVRGQGDAGVGPRPRPRLHAAGNFSALRSCVAAGRKPESNRPSLSPWSSSKKTGFPRTFSTTIRNAVSRGRRS